MSREIQSGSFLTKEKGSVSNSCDTLSCPSSATLKSFFVLTRFDFIMWSISEQTDGNMATWHHRDQEIIISCRNLTFGFDMNFLIINYYFLLIHWFGTNENLVITSFLVELSEYPASLWSWLIKSYRLAWISNLQDNYYDTVHATGK